MSSRELRINPYLFKPIPIPSVGKPIDNGFYEITERQATKLAKASALKRLPRPGHEVLVALDGHTWWLARTVRSVATDRDGAAFWDPAEVWSIRHYALVCPGCDVAS